MAAVLLIVGALLVVAGVTMLSIPAGSITAGVLCLAAGIDWARPTSPTGDDS